MGHGVGVRFALTPGFILRFDSVSPAETEGCISAWATCSSFLELLGRVQPRSRSTAEVIVYGKPTDMCGRLSCSAQQQISGTQLKTHWLKLGLDDSIYKV